MKDACIHPATNKPYIKSAIGGRDNSPSGYQRGMTHAFVMEFENEADQHYYLTQDSSHTGLVQYIRDAVEGVQLIDFIPGRW
ncbi:hypothetical protein MMC07_000550 [Pseudocyphellaria aurata]|nr:hypothetical protein [Pseudocyphellaria aurata]